MYGSHQNFGPIPSIFMAANTSAHGSYRSRLVGAITQSPLSPHVHPKCGLTVLDIILYYTLLNYTIPYYTILYYTILYYTILYYTILYYAILYYTILYYTILLMAAHMKKTPVIGPVLGQSHVAGRRPARAWNEPHLSTASAFQPQGSIAPVFKDDAYVQYIYIYRCIHIHICIHVYIYIYICIQTCIYMLLACVIFVVLCCISD